MSVPIQIEKNIVYGETDTEKLTADVYRPLEGKSLPPILLIHGGAYQSGSKEMYAEWGSFLAKEGFVAMAMNYRLTTVKVPSWPGVMNDINQAANFLVDKANAWNIEPMKMGIIGDSAGAHLGMHFAFNSMSYSGINVLACIGVYGVYDLAKPGSDRESQMFEKLLGKSFYEDPKLYQKASVAQFIDEAVSSPVFNTDFLLIWGEKDKIASPVHSEELSDKMKHAGIEVQTHVFADQGHFWLNDTPGLKGGKLSDYPNTEAVPVILSFLKDKLSPAVIAKISDKQVKKLAIIDN